MCDGDRRKATDSFFADALPAPDLPAGAIACGIEAVSRWGDGFFNTEIEEIRGFRREWNGRRHAVATTPKLLVQELQLCTNAFSDLWLGVVQCVKFGASCR